MGSRLVPLLLLFVVAAGALVWTLFSEGEKPSSRPVGPMTPAAAAEPSAAAEVEAFDGADTRAEVESPAPPRGEPIAAETTRLAPKGAGRIRGQILSATGVPVPGARVGAAGESFGPFDLFGESPFPFSAVRHTETDEEGRFELAGLPPGEFFVAVRAPGFAPFESRGLRRPPGEEPLLLEPFQLAVGVLLEGRVVDAAGAPVADARLYSLDDFDRGGFVMLGGLRRHVASTDAGGFFRIDTLATGPYRIEVQSDRHPSKRFEGTVENAGQLVAGLVFQLDRGDSIAGRVVELPEGLDEHLVVRARESGEGDFGFGGGRRAEVGPDGRFVVEGLRAGRTYNLQLRAATDGARGWGRGASRSSRVEALAGATGVELVYRPAAQLVFQVLDRESGLPVTEMEVAYGTDWTLPLEDDQGHPRRAFPDGRVRIDDLRPEGGRPVQLEIDAVGYRSYRDEVRVAPGTTTDLGTILLDPVPVVRVTVLDRETGEPVAGARVSLAPRPDPVSGTVVERRISIGGDLDASELFEGPGSSSAVTDEEGLAVLTSLEGQTCNVGVRADGYALGELRDLFLPPGAVVEETLRLSRGGSVEVTVVDASGQPLAGARVRHRSPGEIAAGATSFRFGGGDGRGVTDSDGRVVFPNLETGEHGFAVAEEAAGAGFVGGGSMVLFGADGEDDGWSTVVVSEGERSRLTLVAKPRGSLAGQVTESGKRLTGATVELREKGSRDGGLGFLLPGMGGETARTDGDGRFLLEDLKVGEYTLIVRHPTRRMPAEFDVEIREGENRFDPALSVSVLEGRVLDTEGKPLAGVRVSAERATAPEDGRPQVRAVIMVQSGDGDLSVSSGGSGGGGEVTTDADGRYELRGVLPDVELVVRARGADVQPGASDPVTVGPDEIRGGVDVVLQPGGKLALTFLGPDGSPARFTSVNATFLGEGEEVEPRGEFFQGGEGVLDGLRPGPWRLTAQTVGPGDGASDEELVEVVAGRTVPVTFRLE